MLEREVLDGVMVGTRCSAHAALAAMVIRRGIPMFLEKRVYQGSSGRVYPHPVTDKIFDEKADKAYRAIFLENDFIRVMLLPEIGGRIAPSASSRESTASEA